MPPAIEVRNLGKMYRLGLTHSGSIREAVNSAAGRLLGRSRRSPHANGSAADQESEFWALQDVSFDVQPGEAIGVIGKNGAGKSTLLKILSRITRPTTGRASLNGRVASLLEVGTGFHPELTGRENVFLNGTLLGMSKREVAAKFDEIVAFSGIEKFIDTPTKRYSSGMSVRLGFAVAAHLQPEILIVDEVLAVGDAEFQAKCLGRMRQFAGDGRTVLFVSHNMVAVRRLCTSGLLLQNGQVIAQGSIAEVADRYTTSAPQVDLEARAVIRMEAPPEMSDGVAVRDLTLYDAVGNPLGVVRSWDTVVIGVEIVSEEEVKGVTVEIVFMTPGGEKIISMASHLMTREPLNLSAGRNTVKFHIQKLPMAGGLYPVSVGVAKPRRGYLFRQSPYCYLNVTSRDVYGSGYAMLNETSPILVDGRFTASDSTKHCTEHEALPFGEGPPRDCDQEAHSPC